jgi:hypothetical protein
MGLELPFLKKKKTIDEMEEDTEELEVENREKDQELSLEQKRVAIAELKQRGLKPSHFPSWDAIKKFLKTH